MTKKELLIIADYSEENVLTLRELCDICDIRMDVIQDYISYQIVEPLDQSQKQWVFNVAQLRRIQTALRLQRDLEINLAGAALVLDLLEELESLRQHANLLEKHLLKR